MNKPAGVPGTGKRLPDPILSGELGARASRAIGAMLRTLLLVLPVLLVATLFSSTRNESMAVGSLLLAVAGVTWLHHVERLRSTIYALVALLVAYGIAGVVTFGSIRGAAVLSFVGAVIIGGIFLNRTALTALVVICTAAIGALVYAETAGWLVHPHYAVGALHWLVHSAVIGAVALNVYYARVLVVSALLHARGSEERLAKLFRSNPNMLLTTDLEAGRILETNETFIRAFGVPRNEAIGATTVELGLWNDLSERTAFLARAQSAGRVENMPATLKRRNGETFEALMSCEILEVGDTRQLLTTAVDISELVRVRTALRKSAVQFSKIFHANPAALLRTSLDAARILDMNDSFARLFGMDRDAAIGEPTTSFDLWQNPSDREKMYALINAGGRVENLPGTFKRRNGEPFEALISAVVFDLDGEGQLLSTITDISELNRVRAALRSSEEKFERIFHASPSAIVVTAYETRELISANAAAERIFRLPAAQAIGLPQHTRFYADAAQDAEIRATLVARGRVTGVPVQLLRADGERFAARISQEILEYSGKKQVITSIEDVSAEEAAREALEQSEQRFSSAFRLSPVGMTITRISDGAFLEVNDADFRTLGYRREELVGKSSVSLGFWRSDEDRNRFLETLHAEGSVAGFENRARSKSGELVDCMLWATKVEINGEPCVLATTLNVTAQKREEALILDIARGVSGETGEPFFRSLVTHLGHALNADIVIVGELVGDGDARVRTLAMLRDGAFAPNYEYPLEGTPCRLATGNTGLTVYADRVSDLFPQDAALVAAGMRGYVGVSLRDTDGKAIGILNIVCRSPIEQMERTEALFKIFAARAQAELLRMHRDREINILNATLESRVIDRTARLEAANRELEAFSYSVSHDLRAPLRAIDGFVRVLTGQHGDVDPALREKAKERVVTAVRRMNDLIDDLLGLAQVSRQEILHEHVDLCALVRETAGEQRDRAPEHRVELRLTPAGATVRCDRALMRVVLENLIGNAWKFTGRRADARVEFGTERQPGGEIAYYVRDNGAGFDPAYADRLFAPFQRLHTEKEFQGTGIGLATVQRIIARHGGRVWAVSEPEKGATFYFTCGKA